MRNDPFPDGCSDWELQSRGDSSALPSEIVLDERFLEPGRFRALPPGVELPAQLYSATHESDITPLSIEDPGSQILHALGRSMDDQWSILHDRASRHFTDKPNANTLTRWGYNTFGLRHILTRLERHDSRLVNVLLVTAYESPIELLLESERVAAVTVVDLSPRALEIISERYSGHEHANKVSLRLFDVSGIDPDFQASEIDELVRTSHDAQFSMDAIRRHFARLAEGRHLVPLELETDSFHGAHLPIVLGSLYLGPITAASRRHHPGERIGCIDYSETLGDALRTTEAHEACLAVGKHALSETRRIVVSAGCIVANIWARQQRDALGQIRMSDTLVSPETFDELLSGSRRLFSGNPQPNLLKTVGHVFGW